MGLLHRGLGLAFILVTAGQAGAAPAIYTVTLLSELGEGRWDHLKINDAGQVMGMNGVLAPGGAFTPLPFQAKAINEAGQVVGAQGGVAKLWSAATGAQDIAPGAALGINDNGEIVGYIEGPTHPTGWRWTAATGVRELRLEGQAMWGAAVDVNDAGQVIGYNAGGPLVHIWPPGSVDGTTIGLEFPQVYPQDINNHGQITGQGSDYSAILYTPGIGFQSLGKLGYDVDTWGHAVNDLGQVVGLATDDIDTDPGTGFLWTPKDGMLDLNALLDPNDAGWFILQATDINNLGQIVGHAVRLDPSLPNNGRWEQPTPVLLTQVPEPGLVVAALGCVGLLLKRRHRSRVLFR